MNIDTPERPASGVGEPSRHDRPTWERIELPPRPDGPPRREVSRLVLIGGVVAAVVTGAVLGLVARPDLGEPPAPKVTTRTMPIEVAEVRPEPVPEPVGKLEVLPADMARAAQVAANARPSPALLPSMVEVEPEPDMPVVVRQRASADPSFNCRYARTQSESLVCGDRELARLDRRLASAFDRALRAGVPFRELRAEQDDWLEIREDAARHSPGAVASVYRQRIQELDALAEDLG